jgi:hypothetical protein
MVHPVALTNSSPLRELPGRKTPAVTRDSSASVPVKDQPVVALADSIKSDGGLAFLQSHLEDQMATRWGAHPEPASPVNGTSYPDAGVEDTPERTAGRIVDFALGLRQAFDRQHADLEPTERRARFEAEVRRGIEEGFGTARQYLADLGADDDETTSTVDQTWAFVQERLDAFFTQDQEDSSD